MAPTQAFCISDADDAQLQQKMDLVASYGERLEAIADMLQASKVDCSTTDAWNTADFAFITAQ